MKQLDLIKLIILLSILIQEINSKTPFYCGASWEVESLEIKKVAIYKDKIYLVLKERIISFLIPVFLNKTGNFSYLINQPFEHKHETEKGKRSIAFN